MPKRERWSKTMLGAREWATECGTSDKKVQKYFCVALRIYCEYKNRHGILCLSNNYNKKDILMAVFLFFYLFLSFGAWPHTLRRQFQCTSITWTQTHSSTLVHSRESERRVRRSTEKSASNECGALAARAHSMCSIFHIDRVADEPHWCWPLYATLYTIAIGVE